MKLPFKLLTLLASTTLMATLAAAQVPVATVDPQAHGNLASAQQSIIEAFNFISSAQRANDDQLGGHAGRAKDLLRQANDEITAAAAVADTHQDGPFTAPPSNAAPTPPPPPPPPPHNTKQKKKPTKQTPNKNTKNKKKNKKKKQKQQKKKKKTNQTKNPK